MVDRPEGRRLIGPSRAASKIELEGDGTDHLDRFVSAEGRLVPPLFHRIHNRIGGEFCHCRLAGYNLEVLDRTFPPDGGFQNQQSVNSKVECTGWKFRFHAVEELLLLFHFTHANWFR